MDSLQTQLAHIPWKKLLYPGLLALVCGGVLAAFFISTRSLTREFNRIFILDTLGDTFSLDLVHYRLVAQRLALPETVAVPEPAATATSTAETTAAAAGTAPQLDKKALAIAVYNATSLTGLAGKLKAQLEADGFLVAKTGNLKSQPENTIEIKESKKDYLAVLAPTLGASFDTIHATTLPDDASVDCVLTIGKE